MKHFPSRLGSSFGRSIYCIGGLLLALLAAQTTSAAVIFSDGFSDGSASNWRVRSATGTPNWSVANDNPTGEPSAGSQWLYANSESATFAFIQSPNLGFSGTASVTAGQSVALTTGVEYQTSVLAGQNGRIELFLTTTNSAWTTTSATDVAYGLQLLYSGTDFSLSILKRTPTGASNLGTSTAFTLAANTYYKTQLTIADGGLLSVGIYDATGSTLLGSTNATDTTYTSFNSVLTHFRTSDSTTGFRVSDFEVQTIAVPEPSAFAVAGVSLMLWQLRRKRREAQMI